MRASSTPKFSQRVPSIPAPCTPTRRDWTTLLNRIGRWRKRRRWVQYKLKAVPRVIRVFMIAVAALAVFSAANLVYQVLRKPAEVFSPISGGLNKAPIETWRQYAQFFREYSTASVSPALLAALAQIEGAGNPIASTYWRWRLTWNPFEVYQPASSSVGMFQMTDAAFAEARRYCIRHHTVVENGCLSNAFDSRIIPSRAIELTAVFLDRNVTAILRRRPNRAATGQQKDELAAIIHLCGAGFAKSFVRRGFHLLAGERCGDHDVATYLARIKAAKQMFLRVAADG